jgi:hypothetical protein
MSHQLATGNFGYFFPVRFPVVRRGDFAGDFQVIPEVGWIWKDKRGGWQKRMRKECLRGNVVVNCHPKSRKK